MFSSKSSKEHRQDDAAPPYHDWQSVPDTALLPPPPAMLNLLSPTSNASEMDDIAAEQWLSYNPVFPAQPWAPAYLDKISHGAIDLSQLPRSVGKVKAKKEPGRWEVSTQKECTDTCVLSMLPLYAPQLSSSTVYFEVKILELTKNKHREPAVVAIGFVAPPYPSYRLPGWHRGSLAVHSDDGHRYVNEADGGRDFVTPFNEGDVVGIGMKWLDTKENALPPDYNAASNSFAPAYAKRDAEIFFARNGKVEGKWHLREEVDAQKIQPGGLIGLEGDFNLHAAIGFYGKAEVEVLFGPAQWRFQP